MSDLKENLKKKYSVCIEYSAGDSTELELDYTNARNLTSALKDGRPAPVIALVDIDDVDTFIFTDKVDILRIKELK